MPDLWLLPDGDQSRLEEGRSGLDAERLTWGHPPQL